MDNKKFYKILNKVEKPARYVGKERNSVIKNKDDVDVRFAFAFPDTYEIGMSHLGLQILYNLINSLPYAWCERVFAPNVDFEELMRKENISLFSIESRSDIREFDFFGFTLQYEMSYTNILNMLNLSNIPYYSKDRDDSYPIIVVGGPCAYNAEPIADFVDVIQIGEGEQMMVEFLDIYKKHKNSPNYSKKAFLLDVAQNVKGIYVPSFYDVKYNDDGTFKCINPIYDNIPSVIKKRIVENFDESFYPKNLIVPNIEVIHSRIMLEIFRGCTRGCRFCQAGMLYRPIRERSIDTLEKISKNMYKNSGFEEISLVSLSSSDYSDINTLIDRLNDVHEVEKTSISLPSLRLDGFSLETAEKVQKVKKSGMTFAPEAGSQRMRDVINKGVTTQDLQDTMTKIFSSSYQRVKLYSMIGLPYETYEDLDAIRNLGYTALEIYRNTHNGKLHARTTISLSSSHFVPKPFTPFQWFGQNSLEEMKKKQYYIKDNLKSKNITFSYHDPLTSRIEAVLARGDRRQSKAILRAYELGCKMDGWGEHFKYDLWVQAFEECNLDIDFYATRERAYDEIFPWDHIDCGVDKAYLIRENEKAKAQQLTKDCRLGCTGCRVNKEIAVGLCG
jgi:radical SAM domain protein